MRGNKGDDLEALTAEIGKYSQTGGESALNRICEGLVPTVAAMVGRLSYKRIHQNEREDLQNYCLWQIARSIQRGYYDSSKPLAPWIYQIVKNSIDNAQHKITASLDKNFAKTKNKQSDRPQIILTQDFSSLYVTQQKAEDNSFVDLATLLLLSKHHKEDFRLGMLLFLGYSRKEIAARYNLTSKTMGNKFDRLVKHLKALEQIPVTKEIDRQARLLCEFRQQYKNGEIDVSDIPHSKVSTYRKPK